MSPSSKKKKKSTSLERSSESRNTSRSDDVGGSPERTGSKKKKKVWTLPALQIHMKPTPEEVKYRKTKLDSENLLEKYSRYFKCTKCLCNFKPLDKNIEKIAVHTHLKVLFCKDCLDFYQDGEFSMDSDGEEKYCRLCGEGGLIFSCSECVSGFCNTCIKKHCGVKYSQQVKKNNSWKCFICFPKPLWFLRFICSIVEQQTNYKISVPTPVSKSGNGVGKAESSKPKCDDHNIQLSTIKKRSGKTSRKFEDLESTTSCSVILSDAKEPASEVTIDSPKPGVKRKRLDFSSSDESDAGVSILGVKKLKVSESFKKSPTKSPRKSQTALKPEIMEKLEKILRLAEYQMAFGVSWSSKMLTKLFKQSPLCSSQELKNECQKIKWFFSILSTYLVESCSSVDAIEKSIECEQKIFTSPEKVHEGDYSTVVKFLDFVTNQVKVFLEKGISLQELLEGEIYYDSQVIGIKVKSKPSTSTSDSSQSSTRRSKFKSDEYKSNDGKVNSGEKTSDDESIVPTLEVDAERDSSETDDYEANKVYLSNPDYLEDAEEQKTKIQEILSILENA